MPFKTKAEQDAYNKQYYQEQRENILRRLKERRATNPEEVRKKKRDYYHSNREEIRDRAKEKYAATKRKAVAYLGGICQQCGLEDECINVYEFHHKNPAEKDFEISTKTRRLTLSAAVKKELDKCELLCSNCHRKKHGCCKRKIQ